MKNFGQKHFIEQASRIFGYLTAICVAVLFALYLNAGIGWTFVYVLTIAAIFSIAVTVAVKKLNCITITCETSSSTIYKNELLTLRVKVKNNWIFPIPLVELNLFTPDTLRNTDENSNGIYSVSIAPRSEVSFEVKYKVSVWGRCNVGIKSIRLLDFMRFVSFSLYNETGFNQYSEIIKVIPNIPELAPESLLLREVSETALIYDDSEDTKETPNSTMFSGIAGYSHREYVEGDPLKRINWKLSMKRDVFMIRLDDEVESVQQNIVLDTLGGNNVYDNERAIEGLLALCNSIVMTGFEPKLCYKHGNEFVTVKMSGSEDVIALQTAFADYSFSQNNGFDNKTVRIPDEMQSSTNLLIYTPFLDLKLLDIVSSMQEKGSHVSVVSSDTLSDIKSDFIWHLKEDFSAQK